MNLPNQVRCVARHVRKCGLQLESKRIGGYSHMGAILADAVLQAGVSYKNVVAPRVNRILSWHPHATTTSDLLDLIALNGLNVLLQWKHPEKPRRFLELAQLLYICAVETEADLRSWIHCEQHQQKLRSLRGIGPKTIDYLKSLVGISAVAVDRHIRNFARIAGVSLTNYHEIRSVIEGAADSLGIAAGDLDVAIWSYMSIGGVPAKTPVSHSLVV